jgi:hypothetical protein
MDETISYGWMTMTASRAADDRRLQDTKNDGQSRQDIRYRQREDIGIHTGLQTNIHTDILNKSG